MLLLLLLLLLVLPRLQVSLSLLNLKMRNFFLIFGSVRKKIFDLTLFFFKKIGPDIIPWLTAMNLEKYKDNFISNGYLEPLYLADSTRQEIEELGVTDPADWFFLLSSFFFFLLLSSEESSFHSDKVMDAIGNLQSKIVQTHMDEAEEIPSKDPGFFLSLLSCGLVFPMRLILSFLFS